MKNSSKKRIFIWVAHPKSNSLCESLAKAYQSGITDNSDAEVRIMNLSDMSFDPGFTDYKTAAPLEQDLISWQENIAWADHLLFVYPYWWGAMPAKMKAVLDRALTPGFAFKYHRKAVAWDKLLKGKTADAIITADTPTLIDTFIYGKPARRVIKNQVYDFCGITPKKIVQFGSVKLADDQKIQKWIKQAKRMGAKAAKSQKPTPALLSTQGEAG